MAPGGLLGLKDVNTYLDVDGSNNLTFTDAIVGTATLSQLIYDEYSDGGESKSKNRIIGNTDNYSLSLYTNNTSRIHIAEDGKVGIATTVPLNKLSLEGGMRIGSGTGSSERSTNVLHFGDASYVHIGEFELDDLLSFYATRYNFTNGFVGINNPSPQRTLHVNDVIRLEPRATAPSDPEMGDMYINSANGKLTVYDGTDWQECW
jgi:hypothetical protein